VAVIAILAATVLPALQRGKTSAKRAECVNNLRQLGLAAQMYWDDNAGACFRWSLGPTTNGHLFWFGWMQSGIEGQRQYDPTQGVLFPYLRSHAVGTCSALNSSLNQFKLKATGASYGYGYNRFLSSPAGLPPLKVSRIPQASQTALFADAAQVNDFQAPASKTSPLLEEWYYVDTTANYPNGHFRHHQRANVVFCDTHVGSEKPVPGSLDPRLPAHFVGRLRTEILTVP
jgi:prepilin-type processing-associated H-X9-DG protein